MRRSCLRTGVTGKRTGAGIPGSGIHVTHEPYQKLLRYLGDPGVMGIFKKTLKTTLEKRMNLDRLNIIPLTIPTRLRASSRHGGTAGFLIFFTKTAAGCPLGCGGVHRIWDGWTFLFRIAKISVFKRKWSIPH